MWPGAPIRLGNMPLWGHGTMWVFGRQVRETVGLAWAWPTWAVRWPAWAVLCDVRICGCSRPWVGMIPWRREWLPIPVFLPGEFHGQKSLAGYSPWGHKELDVTERLTASLFTRPFQLRAQAGEELSHLLSTSHRVGPTPAALHALYKLFLPQTCKCNPVSLIWWARDSWASNLLQIIPGLSATQRSSQWQLPWLFRLGERRHTHN